MNTSLHSVDAWSALAPREFVDAAYTFILRRAPTPAERETMLAALLRGDTRTWLLGSLRYSAEGEARGVEFHGLHSRYLAQRVFRMPVVGPVVAWINAVVRLPSSLRYFRSVSQIDADERRSLRRAFEERWEYAAQQHAQLRNDVERALSSIDRLESDLERVRDAAAVARQAWDARLSQIEQNATADRQDAAGDRARIAELERSAAVVATALDQLRADYASVAQLAHETRSGLDAISPPALDDTFEVVGSPLAALARQRAGLPDERPISALSADERYTMFESVFYESPAVAAKQRVYVPYLNRELTEQFPVLDLGCGRGEFLRILRESGVRGVGVDINATGLARLRDDGFEVVKDDLVHFLERDQGVYAAVVMLQVAEHLSDEQLDRMLALAAARIAPRGTLIVETPNPLSSFALAVFHTDATHIRPLPPERMRYSIEAAGFEQSRTLFQARIPRDQFAGPDPRAYYADYAIIAKRSTQ